MKCHYCDKDCVLMNPYQMIWTCISCFVDYGKGYMNMGCQINNKMYLARFKYEHTDFPFIIYCSRDEIIKLSKIPEDINPSNIKDKIKLWLTFS